MEGLEKLVAAAVLLESVLDPWYCGHVTLERPWNQVSPGKPSSLAKVTVIEYPRPLFLELQLFQSLPLSLRNLKISAKTNP